MKSFLLKSNNIERDSFVWNMCGSLLMAFQSVIFLMILSRTVGLLESGIFTIAYANANLFLNIGKYGMRDFQVSDVKKQSAFSDYLVSRCITTFVMIVVAFIYVIYISHANGYSSEKSLIIIWMCLFKVVDSIEDVYFGDYQKKQRLDVAAKILTIRMVLTIVFFAIIVILTRNLLLTLIVSTIFTTVLSAILIGSTRNEFKEEIKADFSRVKILLYGCFSLFLCSFLSFYIANAPKYAIDAQLSDEIQACYGFVSMPVFVIGLLNGFIFNPIIFKMSCMWNEKKIDKFVYMVLRQIVIVIGITIVCLIGAYVLGIPVLTLLYNTDLSLYKSELLLLLLGGGFLGLSGVLKAAIIIMRKQKYLTIGYGAVSIIAFLISNEVVQRYEMIGAAILYTVLMALLCACFMLILYSGVKENSTKSV